MKKNITIMLWAVLSVQVFSVVGITRAARRLKAARCRVKTASFLEENAHFVEPCAEPPCHRMSLLMQSDILQRLDGVLTEMRHAIAHRKLDVDPVVPDKREKIIHCIMEDGITNARMFHMLKRVGEPCYLNIDDKNVVIRQASRLFSILWNIRLPAIYR